MKYARILAALWITTLILSLFITFLGYPLLAQFTAVLGLMVWALLFIKWSDWS